jgi:hypothetical protein
LSCFYLYMIRQLDTLPSFVSDELEF